ncbi:MAG TPA: two-component regulator propeller domain-containing protein, partial [Acidobacteriaceae bacterium]
MRSRFNARWNRRAVSTLVCFFFLLANRSGVAAASSSAERFPYTRTVWHVANGLPEDTVQALIESSDGRLWIGTTGGLARFDGAGIELQGLGGAQPLTASSIFCLAIARDGSLWAGTEGGGLLRLKDGHSKIYSAREGLSDGFVRSVFEDDRSRLWV